MLRLWEREARFYLDLAGRLPVRTPRCYYAGGDHESGIFALLLEDLSPFVGGDQVAGATPQQAAAAIGWLGRFHAAEMGGGHASGMNWIPATASDPMYLGLQPMLEAVFPGFADSCGPYAPPGTIGWVEKFVPRLTEAIAEQMLPPTVIHSDFRVDNLFFDGDEVIALDWQAVALGQGLYDLAYFMCGSVDTVQRRATERDLVASYGQTLAAAGVDVPGSQELFDLYRRTVLYTMAIGALLTGQLDLMVNERGKDLARLGVERLYTAGADLRVDEFLE
jgi:hypothetical protein